MGGQAFWSLGGFFLVDSAQQRRSHIKDSKELALHDWLCTARFDRKSTGDEEDTSESTGEDNHDSTNAHHGSAGEDGRQSTGEADNDYWPRRWAEAFVEFAADKSDDGLEAYATARGIRFLSDVGWAERGDGRADGHGNSVPRFHMAWGTGPEVVRVFLEPVLKAEKEGLVNFRFRDVVDEVIIDPSTGRAMGVHGRILEEDNAARGVASSRTEIDTFELLGSAVAITSGGIAGNLDALNALWPTDRLGPTVPERFVVGVPPHVDGRMLSIAERVEAHIINVDRMWHYTEGLQNYNPVWRNHGTRVLPGPSSLWLDAAGRRLPPFLYPGCDNMAALKHICATGHDYSWLILNHTIVACEFTLSASAQMPEVTEKSRRKLIRRRLLSVVRGPRPVRMFVACGLDFVVSDDSSIDELVKGMNALAAERSGPVLDPGAICAVVAARDDQFSNPFSKDAQAMLIRNARQYWNDRRSRVARPHRILDSDHGPLIAVRLNLLTRTTQGGIETDLQSRVMKGDGRTPIPGLYAAGEAAGFGGGGMHGYSSLEDTFLGGLHLFWPGCWSGCR